MTQLLSDIQQTQSTFAYSLNGTTVSNVQGGAQASSLSVQCNITVNTPAAKTFASTAVNTGTSQVTIAAHGFTTGLVGQMTTTVTLPTGLSTSTNYYIIVVDANTVQFASSLANAQAGTAITLSAQGSGNDTFTPTALAGGSVQLQKSNDGVNWSNEGSSVSVAATGIYWMEKSPSTALKYRIAYALTSGSMTSSEVWAMIG